MPILPGSTLGLLGGGQLGRMFVTAARAMGYEVIVLDPDPNSPAGSMATEHLQNKYDDEDSLNYLKLHCDVITTEFENIPVTSLESLSQELPVHPSPEAVLIAQNRIREKSFIQSLGLSTSPFITLETEQDLNQVDDFKFPAILKTSSLGYDGKGQVVCHTAEDVRAAFIELGTSCILEQRIDLAKEISVVLARSQQGESYCFPVAENEHVNGILDVSIAPAEISDQLREQAQHDAMVIARSLNYCGVLAVEFFISVKGELLVNEIAPRPHNSGHYTLDACYTSQFEQQVRMICGLSSGDVRLHTPVAMLNLLGDVWPDQGCPEWDRLLDMSAAHLHLYGKKHARIGRKMGHINFLSESVNTAKSLLSEARTNLK